MCYLKHEGVHVINDIQERVIMYEPKACALLAFERDAEKCGIAE